MRPAPASTPARIVIVDDHDLARAGLAGMLAREPDLTLVGEAANGREGVELCRALEPDLALLDVSMPEMDGMAATRAIKQACPTTRVLIVTMYENQDYLFEALKAGAAGYVLKEASRRELLIAVRQVLRGEIYLYGEMAAQLLHRLAGQAADTQEHDVDQLTPRELEVLRELVQGKTNRQIAAALSVSPATVKVHVQHIIAKLGVADRTQAAVRAIQHGLIDDALDQRPPR